MTCNFVVVVVKPINRSCRQLRQCITGRAEVNIEVQNKRAVEFKCIIHGPSLVSITTKYDITNLGLSSKDQLKFIDLSRGEKILISV